MCVVRGGGKQGQGSTRLWEQEARLLRPDLEESLCTNKDAGSSRTTVASITGMIERPSEAGDRRRAWKWHVNTSRCSLEESGEDRGESPWRFLLGDPPDPWE